MRVIISFPALSKGSISSKVSSTIMWSQHVISTVFHSVPHYGLQHGRRASLLGLGEIWDKSQV